MTDPAQWSYVVLEEMVGGTALLRRWPWPVVDPYGRLLWPDGLEQDNKSATIRAALLDAQLYDVNGLVRDPRVGDVFAVHGTVGTGWRGRAVRNLEQLFGEAAVYDITAAARGATKTAVQASLGAVCPASQAPGLASFAPVPVAALPRLRLG